MPEENGQEPSPEQEPAQEQNTVNKNEHKVIDEANYKHYVPAPKGPAAVGRGGDEFYSKYKGASIEQLQNLLNETATIQDWSQREQSNQAALACLDSEDLREIYFKIKDGFKDYGRVMLMGFKTPHGVSIPRLKIYNKDGEVEAILSGPDAIEEIRRRGAELDT